MPTRLKMSKYADDPMVPIFPPALSRGLSERRMTASALASRINVTQQAISYLTKWDPEKPKRCRRSRLKAIAKALRVPESFLQGEGMVVPHGRGRELTYSQELRLAVGRLCTRARAACVRDIRAARERGEDSSAWEREAASEVVESIGELLSVGGWRHLLIVDSLGAIPQRRTEPPLQLDPLKPSKQSHPDHTRATLALVDAFEEVLSPWLEGRAVLNYGALRDLTRTPAAEPKPARTSPRDVIVTWNSWQQMPMRNL